VIFFVTLPLICTETQLTVPKGPRADRGSLKPQKHAQKSSTRNYKYRAASYGTCVLEGVRREGEVTGQRPRLCYW